MLETKKDQVLMHIIKHGDITEDVAKRRYGVQRFDYIISLIQKDGVILRMRLQLKGSDLIEHWSIK